MPFLTPFLVARVPNPKIDVQKERLGANLFYPLNSDLELAEREAAVMEPD